MNNPLFDSWHQWQVCMVSGLRKLAWGLFRVFTCLLFGFLSVIRWLWRLLVKGVGCYPAATIFIAVLLIVGVWLFTYTRLKAQLVSAEYERDTISYRLQKFEKMYEEDTDSLIIVRKEMNDTLTFNGDDK